ncbi:MAG TPA: thioredoxin family protein [Ktedonobacterales bacterium]
MPGDILLRIVALAGVALIAWLAVVGARAYAAARKRQALGARLAPELAAAEGVRVLAFSSEDCSPCHTLQRPALYRLLDARQGRVSVVEIDAPTSPELAERYAVLTVPTTVVLDDTGRARAINYGFAPLAKLLEQVDDALAVPVA